VEWWHLYMIMGTVVAGVAGGVIYIRKKMKKRLEDQESMVKQHKVATSILVLEKKKEKISNANIPKSVVDKIPRVYKIKKVPIVKAKIGAQVMDLLCDEDVFDKLPERKSVRVDLAGIFIAGVKPGKGKK